MKAFWKTKDGVTDNLLRAYVSRPTNPSQARQGCPDFDPDLANAYIERALTPASRSRYEVHLSECAGCRKNVVALSRLSGAIAPGSASTTRDISRAPWLASVTQIFGALSRPQWAMAATAVIVLAISLPLLLSRNHLYDQQASRAVAEPSAERSAASQPELATAVVDRKSAEASTPASPEPSSRHHEKRESGTIAANTPAPPQTVATQEEAAAGSEQSQKLESKSAPQTLDQVQQKSDSQVGSQAARAQAPGETQVARNDSDRARQEQQGKDSAQATAPKPVAADESTDKEKERRAEAVAVAPPPAPSSPELARGGRSIRPPGKFLRDSRSNEAVRPNEFSFRGKKFLFKGDTWTDKEFEPDKNLPMVTIIRDSNVYKELLSKQKGLKPFLTVFAGTDRAIIVYKDTVYKLIPQQSNK